MRLVIQAGGKATEEVNCGAEAILIGSDAACSIVAAGQGVLGRHATIFPDETGGWVVEPLDQDVGVELNGVTIREPVQIRGRDEIRIGETTIRAVDDQQPAVALKGSGISVAQMAKFVQAQLPQGSFLKKSDDPITLTASQVARLGRLNVVLGGCNMVEELMTVVLQTLHESFAAVRAWIGIRRVNYGAMEYVEGRTLAGHTFDLPELGDHLKPRALDRSQYVYIPPASLGMTVMLGPIAGPEHPLGMVYVDTGDSGRHLESTDIDFFIAFMNVIGAQLDAIFRSQAKTRAATLDGEVVVAHAIQSRLTPRKLPQWEGLTFGAFRTPGRERTSDVYDVVKMASGAAAIMIAHSHAVGPLPGMVMTQAQAAFRSAIMHNDPPHVFMRMLNILLYDPNQDYKLDCFMGIVDPASGQLRYSLAGRVGAFIIGGRGEERRLEGETVPLGVNKTATYNPLSEQLDGGETMVLFTPGVISTKNSRGETFGEDRFVNILCDGFGQGASGLLKDMYSDLQHFTEGGQQPEDITVILSHKVG